jgi:hypothetical protein
VSKDLTREDKQGCLMAVVVTALIPVGWMLNGWALMTLWGWFVTPTFGTPVPTMACAIGLSAIAGYLTWQPLPDVETKEREKTFTFSLALTNIIGRPLFAVMFGWIIRSLFR